MTTAEVGTHMITFLVNGKPIETRQKELTVRAILELAGLDASSHYLVEKCGDGREVEYRDLAKEIHVHEREQFLAFFTGPTPVS
jgi:hypothetical protein